MGSEIRGQIPCVHLNPTHLAHPRQVYLELTSYTIAHPTGASGSYIGEEDIRGLIHDALVYNLFNSDDQHAMVEMGDTHENIGDSGTEDFDNGILYCRSAKMFRFRKSLDKHVLQQPCDQNANHIQPHSQQHCLVVDDQGKVLRMQKMLMKDVYRLLADGERILVHVDDLFQPIKAAGGLCTRMPYTSEMDKVILDKLGSKYRSVKYRYKNKLLKKAKIKLKTAREENGVYIKDEEKNYSQEQLFEALDLENARDLVAKKTMELGISGPIDTAAESEIHNAVWKELMGGETP
ncbi:hypothetical protein Cgig2_030858 [Carnegiea gigantea]|uniref:Uncharacterized protein n=1 Tax=Carnegiea gigantea TaxID=171969 RepID=A0A9Q1KGG2_9CARY|nr:hypothetical protein Cgig2_030858 [Carnegiea gigantea]